MNIPKISCLKSSRASPVNVEGILEVFVEGIEESVGEALMRFRTTPLLPRYGSDIEGDSIPIKRTE